MKNKKAIPVSISASPEFWDEFERWARLHDKGRSQLFQQIFREWKTIMIHSREEFLAEVLKPQ